MLCLDAPTSMCLDTYEGGKPVASDIDPSVIRRIADMHAVYRMFDKDRVTTRKAAPTLGVSVWVVRTYLERLRSEGAAQVYGSGRGGHWHLPDSEGN